jgi:miniconductance mechanosensitive channel
MNSMRFCTSEDLQKLRRIDLIQDFLDEHLASIEEFRSRNGSNMDSELDGPQITNTEVYRAYIEAYLRRRDDIHQSGMPFLVRTLAPKPTGLPIELYIFTKTTAWESYEAIQADIIDHLIAAAPHFGLRVFQEPTGMDFSSFAQGVAVSG